MDDTKDERTTEGFLSGFGGKAILRLLFRADGNPDIYIAVILVVLLLLGQAANLAF